MTTRAEEIHMDKVASLPCRVCVRLGYGDTPATVHHCFTGGGGRRNHYATIPLCPEHHQGKEGIDGRHHGMSKKKWQEKYWTETELLDETIGELYGCDYAHFEEIVLQGGDLSNAALHFVHG